MAEPLPAPSPVADIDLVARARQRDEAAIRILIQRHNRRLFRLVRGVLRDDSDAEDAVQEAYVRAFTRLDQFRGEAAFGTWLCRIALNEALGRARRRTPIEVPLPPEAEEPTAAILPFPLTSRQPDPERTMAQNEIRILLERAIDALPDGFRTVLVARLVEGLSIEETAELLDLRPETVKTRLHRARGLLRARLESQVGPALTDTFPFDGARCRHMADRVVARLRR